MSISLDTCRQVCARVTTSLKMRSEIFPSKLVRKKRITAYALINDGDKFLLAQEAVGKIRSLWGIPGGGVKKGETPRQAAEREVKQETGYEIELTGKIGEYNDTERMSVRNVFSARVIGGNLKVRKLELMDAQWFTLGEAQEIKHRLRGECVGKAINTRKR